MIRLFAKQNRAKFLVDFHGSDCSAAAALVLQGATRLRMLGAMEKWTAFYALFGGVVDEICVPNGDVGESKDLILKIRPV